MLWKEHAYPCYLSACWEPGSQEAWFLISDEPAGRRQVRRYALRMRVEATFQDTKSRGWQIEASRFRQREHLARWLLVVFVAIWWTAHLGASCVHHGHRRLLDRADRRDKGLLRLGRLWLLRLLKEVQRDQRNPSSLLAARLANCLPFHRGEGGLRFAIYSALNPHRLLEHSFCRGERPPMGDASVPTPLRTSPAPTNVTIRPYERDGLLQKPTVERTQRYLP